MNPILTLHTLLTLVIPALAALGLLIFLATMIFFPRHARDRIIGIHARATCSEGALWRFAALTFACATICGTAAYYYAHVAGN